jgi:predicted nucleotidyltransferase
MISQTTVDAIIKTIVEHVHPQKVFLYGSYVYGHPTEDSDLDILIIAESDLPRYKRAREIHRLFNPYPCPMDILVYTPQEVARFGDHPSAFIHTVLEKGDLVYDGT